MTNRLQPFACLVAVFALHSSASLAQSLHDVARLGSADPVRNVVYTIGNDNTLHVIDGVTLQSTSYALGATGPIVVNSVTNKVYIGAANGVVEFDGATHASRTIPMHGTPGALALNVATNRLYAVQPTAILTVFDIGANAVTDVNLNAPATGIGIDAAKNRIYLAGTAVQVVDGATNAVTTTGVAASSGTIIPNPATNKVYMLTADSYAGITQMDGTTFAQAAIPTSGTTFSLAVNPLTNQVYAGTGGSGNVSATLAAINGGTLARTDYNTNNGNLMLGLAVDTTTNRIYASVPATCSTVCPLGTSLILDAGTGTTSAGTMLATKMTVDPLHDRLYGWESVMGPLGASLTTWSSADVSVTPAPTTVNPPSTTITPLTGNAAATSTPRFTFTTTAGVGGMPATAVFYSVDSAAGPWTPAQGTAPSFSARTAALSDGSHTLYAFAVDATVSGFSEARGTSVVGHVTSYAFTVANACGAIACADLSVKHTTVPAAGFTGKDALFIIKGTNNGTSNATNVVITEGLPIGAQFVWASPGCSPVTSHFNPDPIHGLPGGDAVNVYCNVGNLANGVSAQVTVVMRPASAGTTTVVAAVSANEFDPEQGDNQDVANIPVTDPPPAIIVLRYRLYSPASLEHHYTTDLNEYTVLGASGAWVQEGTVGKVLNNPGSFNGVQATPYYRLYNTFTLWHHWTTDPNEYYTLGLFPGWNQEGVDGYILPTQAPGTTQLYRLTYPFIGGLHHWTIDANEYNTLISTYGWVGEGGSGFVIQ
jgi:uncharacterized repeat protein (TIGR01451 family)